MEIDKLKNNLTRENIMCPTQIIKKALVYENGRADEEIYQNFNPPDIRVTYPQIVDTLFHNPFFVPKAKKGKKKKKK